MKFFKTLFVTLICIFMVGVSGCNKTSAECKHANGEWIVDTEATCETEGLRHKECTSCHKKLEEETIAASGHNYVNDVCTKCHEEKPTLNYVIEEGYVLFGEYPQTLKHESVTITSDTPNSKGYYFGSDGKKYIMVVKGDDTSYYKVEPIKWKILSKNGENYQLVTDKIIDTRPFSLTNDQTRDGTVNQSNYEYSDIRKWLNGDFYNQAFNKLLKECVLTTHVDNSKTSFSAIANDNLCNDTDDKVYLLSYKDVRNESYGFANYEESDEARKKQVTDYTKAKGCYTGATAFGGYFLRTPDFISSTCVYFVNWEGTIKTCGASVTDVGISPVITVSLQNNK